MVPKGTGNTRNSVTIDKKQLKELLIQLAQPKIPKNLHSNTPFPEYQERNLSFQWSGILQGAVPFIVQEFVLNSATPDASNFLAGFNEMIALYNFYKVISVKFYYRVAANEVTFPVKFGMIIRDVQPSPAITTYTIATDALEVGPSTKVDMIGQASGMSIFESPEYKIDCGSVIGNRLEYLSGPEYSGIGTANPSQVAWIAFILQSWRSATNLTNGAIVEIFMTSRVQFFSKKAYY